jgi:hypothetical protein
MDSNFWYRGTKAVDFRSIPGIAGGIGGALKRYHLMVLGNASDYPSATDDSPLEGGGFEPSVPP